MGILNVVLWLPAIALVIVLMMPKDALVRIRAIAILASAGSLVLSWGLLGSFDPHGGLQFVERYPWDPEIGMEYYIGVDGLSYPLLLLTTLLAFSAMVACAWYTDRPKGLYVWFLLLEFSMIGVFIAHDWLVFYMFFEISLLPLYFLIGIWGGKNRMAATVTIFLYTLGGSLVVLLAMMTIYLNSPVHTFDMDKMVEIARGWDTEFQALVFVGLFLGFAVKIPAFPFHGWLALAHVEAPTPLSMLLSGVLLKMGAYGVLRAGEMLPLGLEWFAQYLMILGVINLVYGAVLAWRQTDLKGMVAFSSISHMGFVMMGTASLSTAGFVGASMQMLSHGILAAAAFMLVGWLYSKTHCRQLSDFGGLVTRVPVYSAFTIATLLAAMGLPGFSGFVGEFHAMTASIQAQGLWVMVGSAGVLVGMAYSLRAIDKVFMGPMNARWAGLTDMNKAEVVAAIPLVGLAVVLGCFPSLVMDIMQPTLAHIAAPFAGHGVAVASGF
ncbi:MAG: NADH-quinone oxidoreductase subunit M [Proteobacteria bacterium]|nr:NADH-quinone oxidoreductase subunit M [Pseudomonadota bacterium]